MLTQRLGSSTQKDPVFIDSLIEQIQNHPGSCDEVWFATDYGFPPLEIHRQDAELLREQADKFRRIGVRVSLQLSNSIGHGQYMRVRDCSGLVYDGSPAEHMVGDDGTEAGYCFCWNGENFRRYTFEALRYYLRAVKPYCLWVDDDLRASNHAPVHRGCFCDGCIAAFNARYGTSFDREGLVSAIHTDIDIRRNHVEFLRDTLADFTRELGRIVAEEAPGCRMGLQGCANGGYTGYGYEHIFGAMKESTGLAPGSRPGGGSYSDYSPADFINKSTLLAYQNLMLPDYVTDRRPEIESLPDVVFGKSIPGTCFETSCYLAYGNTAMSYAILMNDYEPMTWHGEMLGAFAKHRAYWQKLADVSRRGTLSGLTPFFPKTAYLCESKAPFDYSKEEIYFAEPLRYLAIPIAFTNKASDVYVINGRIAETLNDDEITVLLGRNVICDGAAVKILSERGRLRNVTARETSVQEKRERFTSHPINAGMERRGWGGQIWRQKDYELSGEDLEILSEYVVETSGRIETVGIASAVFTTPAGAKWACFGFDLWARTKSTEKRRQLLNACRYISGRGFLAELLTPMQACVIPNEDERGKCIAVSLINCTVGDSGELKLRVRDPNGDHFTFMGQAQAEITVPAEKTADNEYEITLPSIPGWSVATVFCG